MKAKDWLDCWCYAKREMTKIRGNLVGKRQAQLLEVTDCERQNCDLRNDLICLIGKVREGVWTT